ncbi:MAG TPA: alpha/beta fold hydrolase, partial [Acidimicrobiia bacterium]
EVFAPIPFPVVKEEVSLFVEGDKLLDKSCRRNGTIVRDHMSTANVARDLDYLRQAVGDSSLNFVGLSYGSYLGQTYAKLFPDKVGAVVIDGVLDPEAWANLDGDLPFSTVLRSDAGAQTTLEEFFRQCEAAGPGNCAFAPDSANRYDLLIERLRQGPVLITDPETGETFPYLYSFLVADTLGALYNPFGYAAAAEFLVFLESQANPAALGAARVVMEEATGLSQRREERRYPNFVEGFPAVACEDTTNPRGHNVWFETGKQATAEFGIFGELWTWASSPCAVWSSFDDDVYKGPFATSTSNPVLVIGNLYDPATRYEGAVTARGLLSNSALLTVDEPGHTSLGISGCAGFLTGVYLEDPANGAQLDGALCPSEGNWFDLAASQFASELGQQFRTRLMEEIAFRP